MLGNNVYLLKSNNGFLSFQKDTNRYIIGFSNYKLAKQMSSFSLFKYNMYDYNNYNNMTLCNMRASRRATRPSSRIHKICINEFMMMPVNKNIGIGLGFEIIDEKEGAAYMTSLIIDPIYDIENYRKNIVI
jgi:hypothetical protein